MDKITKHIGDSKISDKGINTMTVKQNEIILCQKISLQIQKKITKYKIGKKMSSVN